MSMKSVVVVAGAVLILVGAALPAVCGDNLEGIPGPGLCRTDGAWLGTSAAWGMQWMVVYDSDSNRGGHFKMRFLGGDATMGGYFPTAVAFSDTVGSWVRTGRHTSQYTMITYGVDAQGQPVFIAKNSGTSETSPSCDYMEVYDSAISFYHPSQDPFGDDPPAWGCMQDPSVSTARRMEVDPPCVPPAP